MHEMAASPSAAIAAWESFYVIVGSSAAALTGLQFVVIALVAEAGRRSSSKEIEAFGTPTVVHFCAALLVAAILSAPWRTLSNPALALGASGLAGVVYVAIVIQRARHQKGYQPVFEDWLWHAILPFFAYAGLLIAAAFLPRNPASALFAIAAAALLLVFIGIHNSWDTVTYIAVGPFQLEKQQDRSGSPDSPAKPPKTAPPA
ncbi:MAG TPA: hypothetical protein VHC97_13465 [Thermoanaerobaculia bacterium]|jgi:hypothetical protein|nr:hypothetical protein [Thermoanaerobaculia bacterium]